MASLALAVSLLPTVALAEDTTDPQLFINTSGTVEGNVAVDDSVYAVMASGREEGATARAEVTGNVTNSTEHSKQVYGTVSEGRNGGTGQLVVNGDVTVAPADEANPSATVRAVYQTINDGTATAEVTGDVYARGARETTGALVTAFGDAGSTGTQTIVGDVTAVSTNVAGAGVSRTYAVDAQANDQASARIAVVGNVTSKVDGANLSAATGVGVYSDKESSSVVEIQGDVTADSAAEAWGATVCSMGGTARLYVAGDVTATGATNGVGALLESNNGGTPELVVQGTLRGSTTGIEFSGGEGANYDVTVWKIEVDDGDALTRVDPDAHGIPADAASQIKYIIKIEQPQAGGSLTALDGLKAGLAQSNGFDVAHAGDKVYLSIALEAGYHISGAYNGLGEKVQLLLDEGGYYVIVPEGGGVYLTAELGKDEIPEAPTETPASQAQASTAKAAPVAAHVAPARVLPATGDAQSSVALYASAIAGGICLVLSRRRVAASR